jgi:methylglutaconyl-CoA hydratase
MAASRNSGERPTLRVKYSADAGIGRITLARPEKRNALSPETIRQLHAAITAAARDDQVKVVVLGAEGPDFCAGADLDSLVNLVDAGADVHRADARALAELYLAMRALPKPIVGAVQGRALGGGAGIVTACDIVIAASDSQIGYPEVRIGFIAAIVMAMLRQAVPEKAAFELVSTGRLARAEEAARLGLVTRVVPAASVAGEAARLAAEIAALPPESVAGTKKIFYEVQGLTLTEALDRGIEANVSARTTPSFRSGLTSFLSRRRP